MIHAGSNRGARSPGNVKSSTAPPPSSDAISWPTPDLAKDEDKKKSQDRSDKGDTDKTTSKPHGKKEWKTIPYVPSAVFTTPMPQNNRRGGRPRGGRDGGGRGGNHTMNGNVGGDKAPSGSVATSTTTATGSVDRTRGDMGTPKPGQFPSKSKRASSAGPSSSREQRRTGDVVVDETAPKSAPRNTGMDNRRVSSSTQTDGAGQGSPSSRRQQEYSKDDRPQSGISGRREGGPRAGDSSREPNNLPQARERGEGRPDRGRGGYRGGRGGHNGFSGHGFNGQTMPNGYGAAQMSQGFPPSKSQSYSEQRYGSQPQTPSYGPREGKHYRNGSRSQPIPNPPSFGRYPSNGPMAAPHGLPHLQTDAANGFYQPPGVMSAMPFNMIMEQAQLASMIQMQM
jgi:la-related protein 1